MLNDSRLFTVTGTHPPATPSDQQIVAVGRTLRFQSAAPSGIPGRNCAAHNHASSPQQCYSLQGRPLSIPRHRASVNTSTHDVTGTYTLQPRHDARVMKHMFTRQALDGLGHGEAVPAHGALYVGVCIDNTRPGIEGHDHNTQFRKRAGAHAPAAARRTMPLSVCVCVCVVAHPRVTVQFRR